MKKSIFSKFTSLMIMMIMVVTPVFSAGAPVIDIANLYQAIDNMYQIYEQTMVTYNHFQAYLEQAQRAVEQAKNMAAIYEDYKDKVSNAYSKYGDNWYVAAFEGTHDVMELTTKMVNNEMNIIDDIYDSVIDSPAIQIGPYSLSLVDMYGEMAKGGNNIEEFADNVSKYMTKQVESIADSLYDNMDYQDRVKIMRKYGLSARNYSYVYAAEGVLPNDEIAKHATVVTDKIKEERLKRAYATALENARMAAELPDGSLFAVAQLQVSGIQDTNTKLVELTNSMDYLTSMLVDEILKKEKLSDITIEAEYNTEKKMMEVFVQSAFVDNE